MKRTMMIVAAVTVIGGTSAYALTGESEEPRTADLSTMETEELSTENEDTASTEENKQITSKEAVETAKTVVDGTLNEVELDTEDGILIYEVELEYLGGDYDIDIDAHTGEIVKVDDDLLKTPAEDSTNISLAEAEETALNAFAGGKIDGRELEKKNGRFVYELEVEIHGEDGDVYVDAESGEIIQVELDIRAYMTEGAEAEQAAENQSGSDEQITAGEAKEIALSHVGSGYVDNIELEHENGLLVYEVEVEHVSDDVDVYVDAYTGEVVYVD